MKRYFWGIFCLCIFPCLALGQSHPLGRVAQDFSYVLEVRDGRLANEGGEFLLFEATRANFFLIGEEHGIAEVPQVVWAIYNHAYSMGLRFDHLAIEVSPSNAILLEDLALESGSVEGMQEFAKENPGELPFYELKEEQELLLRVMNTAASSAYVLWGLDHEFLLSARSLLQKLSENSQDKKGERLALKYLRQAEKGYEAAIASADPTSLFLLTIGQDDMNELRKAFAEDAENLPIVEALAESRNIYRLAQVDSVSASNSLRENLMKQNFRTYYTDELKRQTKAPRVMAKLGAWHLYNGKKPGIDFASLGRYIFNYSQKNKKRSFNMMVIGGKGSMLSSRNRTLGWETKEGIAKEPWLAPLVDIVPAGKWMVMDLREIRKYLGRYGSQIDPRLEKLIREYEALLVLGGSTPATYP